MTRIILIISFLICNLLVFGQTDTSSRILNDQEVHSIFKENTKRELGIKYSIFRVYEYNDKTGRHYLVLTENGSKDGDHPINDTIQGFIMTESNGQLKTDWKFSDFTLKQGNENSEEYSIWFWTKYVSLSDLDNDGLVDPIVIYGTSGMNGTDDGRIKILTYYKGAKRAIRHQNGVLDFQRNTQVDSMFYELPTTIQEYVKTLINKMMDNHHAIFPAGWEIAMKNKELKFDEK